MIGRRLSTAAVALALLLQILAPPGYMVSGDPAVHGLVICTGHGPLLLGAHSGKPAKAPKSGGGFCPFATHGAAAEPPVPTPISTPALAVASEGRQVAFDLAPGRGLAAPPPPPQAPPSPSI